jgi:hypothetical protein
MKGLAKGIIFLLILITMTATVFAELPEITQVNYSPSPGVPGTTITLLVQIENKTAFVQKEVKLTVENEYPFTIKTSDDKPNPRIIGDMEAYGKALAQFTVYIDPTAENKTYSIPMTIMEKTNPSGKKTRFAILINGKEPVVKVISVAETNLLPGQEKEIQFELQNVGTSPAYDIVLEMQEDRTVTATGTVVERDISPVGAAAAYITSINPGEKKSATLKVSVNSTATIKNYTQPIKISYRNAAGTRTTDTSYIGLKVFSTAELDATLKETSTIASAGQKSDVTIEIFNKGLGKAEFTLVELETTNGTIEKPKQFIGSLGPNDVDTVKTAMTFNKAGENTIIVKITYLDSDAATKTSTIKIKIKTGQETTEGPNLLIGAVIIVVLIAIAWKFVIKKKK